MPYHVNTTTQSLREFRSKLRKLKDEVVSEMRDSPTGYSWLSMSLGDSQGAIFDGGYLVFDMESPEEAMSSAIALIQWIDETAKSLKLGGAYAIQGIPSEVLVIRVFDR
jgi:hypothetical protein